MRRFAQAALVAAAMSAPVFAGVMIAPQAKVLGVGGHRLGQLRR